MSILLSSDSQTLQINNSEFLDALKKGFVLYAPSEGYHNGIPVDCSVTSASHEGSDTYVIECSAQKPAVEGMHKTELLGCLASEHIAELAAHFHDGCQLKLDLRVS